ncbi:MAG: hypothetical protein ABJA35_12240 [Parafilimonas sp.]
MITLLYVKRLLRDWVRFVFVFIAPGGVFHALAMDIEDTPIAKLLTRKDITIFVLKYKLVHDDSSHPENALMNLIANNDINKIDQVYSIVIPA